MRSGVEVIVKFNQQANMNAHEQIVLSSINKDKLNGFPKLLDWGHTTQNVNL